jgi:hypothetical protein
MMLGYVDSAIGRVHAVVAAEDRFANARPEAGYTCTLSQLPHDPLIVRLLKDGKDNGYVFNITGCQPPEPSNPNSVYHVAARPLKAGLPAFCSDQSELLGMTRLGRWKIVWSTESL